MKLGNDMLLSKHANLLAGKRVGVLAHAASLDSLGRHIIDLLMKSAASGGWKVTALFGPEHGLEGLVQDLEPVSGEKFQKGGQKIPVYSLYGGTFVSLSPTPEMLENIDVLVVDLQDIGTRYYTYANTMVLCIRACLAFGKQVIICDRPNPINGIDSEGGTVDEEFRSFVGMFPIPVRHAKTIGELAKAYFQNIPEDKLKIIPMSGWQREWFWDETGLKWTNPSPNMRSLTAALLYPGMCLLEGTNISEARGTKTPFELCGAPWVAGVELAKKMRGLRLAGVDFEPAVFTPTSRKFEGERCEGVQFIVTDRHGFKPYLTGLLLIHTIAGLYRDHFKWQREPYEFVSDIPAIDLLTGNSLYRKLVDKNKPAEDIVAFSATR